MKRITESALAKPVDEEQQQAAEAVRGVVRGGAVHRPVLPQEPQHRRAGVDALAAVHLCDLLDQSGAVLRDCSIPLFQPTMSWQTCRQGEVTVQCIICTQELAIRKPASQEEGGFVRSNLSCLKGDNKGQKYFDVFK
jgi:hypothetical protein